MPAATNPAVAGPPAGSTQAAKTGKKRSTALLRISAARLTPYLLVAITAIGGFFRFYRIGDKGLWLDEAFSVWMGWNSLPELIAWLLRVDQHPPLYYTLLHFWLYLGDNPAQVRMLSARSGTLTIPVIFLIARRISGTPAGLIAAFILALSPFQVRFAQETRMYALLTLNVSLATLALTYLLTDPRAASQRVGSQFGAWLRNWRAARSRASAEEAHTCARAVPTAGTMSTEATTTGVGAAAATLGYSRDFRTGTAWVTAPTERRYLPLSAVSTDIAWLGYMVFAAASVLTHNTAIFYPLAANLFVLGFVAYRHFSSHPQAAVAGEDFPLAPGSISYPHVRTFTAPRLSNWLLAQVGTFLFWSPWLVAFVVQSMGVYGEFWIPAPTQATVINTLKALLSDFLPQRITWDQLIWAGYALLLVLGAVHLRKRFSILIFLLVLVLTPMVGELLVSLRRPIFYDRTLIWITIPLYVLLAMGFVQLRFKPYIFAGLIMLGTINLLSLQNYYDNFEKEQWREGGRLRGQRSAERGPHPLQCYLDSDSLRLLFSLLQPPGRAPWRPG